MLSSLAPVGVATRHGRWETTVASYVAGAAAGGALTGAVLGGVTAGLLDGVAAWLPPLLLGAAAVAGVGVDLVLDGGTGRLPGPRRQVDRAWLDTYRGWVYGGGYGLQLGLGWTTIVPRTVTYAWMVAAALSGSAALGAGVGTAYGLARALPLAATAPVRSGAALRSLLGRLEAWRRPADAVVLTGQAAVGVGALALGLLTWS